MLVPDKRALRKLVPAHACSVPTRFGNEFETGAKACAAARPPEMGPAVHPWLRSSNANSLRRPFLAEQNGSYHEFSNSWLKAGFLSSRTSTSRSSLHALEHD